MAKSRRNRGGAAHRRDPVARQPKPPSDPALAALREAKILPVVRQLRDADPKARSAAAAAIANIAQDTRCRKLLLREQLVHTLLTQTLTDAALESRAAGWGVLQLLVQEEDADFGLHLFRQDVLTAVQFAAKMIIGKIQAKEPAFSSLPKAEQGFVTSIAASLVSLLTALAEAGEDIFDAIAANPVFSQFLSVLVAHTRRGESDALADLRTDALACLMVLCEDNAPLASSFASPDGSSCFQALMALKDHVTCDGVLACAALHNIFASQGASGVDADDSVLIPTLAKVLSTAPSVQAAANGAGWSNPLEQQQLALETLAAIGTSLTESSTDNEVPTPRKQREQLHSEVTRDDEDMGDADVPGSEDEGDEGGQERADDDEDDEMGDDELMADMEMVTGAGSDDGADADDLPVLKALLQTALPQLTRLATLNHGSDNNDAAAVAQLRSHALSALNNMAWSVSLFDLSDDRNAGIRRAWEPAARSLWQQVVSPILASDTANAGLAAQVTGLAWAVSRGLGGRVPLAPGEHRKFIALYHATRDLAPPPADADDDPFQSLGVKCVGVLGQLALDPAPIDVNREIGTFLVALIAGMPATPPAAAVKALNQLFDVYADEAHACDAAVFWKDGFLAQLDAAVPKARAMVKTIDKKSSAELKTRAGEALTNLDRFLAYKRKHQP